MFRTRKRSDEENGQQLGRVPPAPQDLLAKEAAMAEKLLEDLIPEEPPAKKEPEQPKPPAPQASPPVATSAKPDVRAVELAPKPEPKVENAPKNEEKPVEEKPVDARPIEQKPPEVKPAEVKPVKDDLSEIIERIHALGVELVHIRNDIVAAREKYSGKTKELEGLQDKLKGLLGQIG